VRDTLAHVCAKIAAAYPKQSAWWLFHFYQFEESAIAKSDASRPATTRRKFAEDILAMIKRESEDIFKQLKELEKPL